MENVWPAAKLLQQALDDNADTLRMQGGGPALRVVDMKGLQQELTGAAPLGNGGVGGVEGEGRPRSHATSSRTKE